MRLKYAILCGLASLVISSCVMGANNQVSNRRYFINTVYSWWPTYTDLSLFRKFVGSSKQKGMNSITIDIPLAISDGKGACDFTEIDRRVDYVVSREMSVFLIINTTSINGQSPKWLSQDMLQCTRDGKTYKRDTDGAVIPSLANPTVRTNIVKLFGCVSKHYKSRYDKTVSGECPVVCISPAFNLQMESGYMPDAELDYSPDAQADFSKWAKDYYRKIPNLNDKWGTKYTSWKEVSLTTAHETARQLYFAQYLQKLMDDINKASKLPVGIQAGCIFNNPNRRTMDIGPLAKNLDWVFISDAPDANHAFSSDFARCSAPGKNLGSGIDAASSAQATNSRYFNQGVRAFEHGNTAVFVSNWDLSNIRDNSKWPFLHFVGALTRLPSANPESKRAIYVSTWDLINKVASVDQYLPTYDTLSENGKKPVDVLSDYAITKDPKRLSQYTEIYLPANWIIPAEVRKSLDRVKDRLKISKPLVAGTMDEYGRPVTPLVTIDKTSKSGK